MAARIVRAGQVPLPLLRWLAGGERAAPWDHAEVQELIDERLTASMDEILRPLLAEEVHAEKSKTESTAQWLGAACLCAARRYRQLQLGIGPRLVLASLLPLYRCLASGKFAEGLQQSQARLAELLSLLGLCQEVGADLVSVLDTQNHRMDAPGTLLSAQFDLNLSQVAEIMCGVGGGYEPVEQQFSQISSDRLLRADSHKSALVTPDWATPQLLWKLSGELISKNSELVLPRSWIDTPVPWSSVADHWHKLVHLLSQSTAPKQSPTHKTHATLPLAPINIAKAQAKNDVATVAAPGPLAPNCLPLGGAGQEVVNEAGDLRAEADTLAAIAALSELVSGSPAAGQAVPSRPNQQSRETLRIEPSQSASSDPSVANDQSDLKAHSPSIAPSQVQSPLPTDKPLAACLPKVLIAEIRSHNDPVFVNVIRRQIGKCRAEDRAVSLVSMVVLPDDDAERHAIGENGLTQWQQRLVNWLSDHPQVIEPHAFVTSEGELLLALLDLERNETTSLVRHGLVEVLTGRHIDESAGSLLAKVDVPARYHAGIASTSAPGSSFTPEQLIEPAIRCLSAASRHGKASIKSIEVY